MPRKRGSAGELKLIAAYRHCFGGTDADTELVRADLAEFTGYYKITPAEFTDAQLRFAEGKRCVFERILTSLRMTDAEIKQLEEAARIEALSNREG